MANKLDNVWPPVTFIERLDGVRVSIGSLEKSVDAIGTQVSKIETAHNLIATIMPSSAPAVLIGDDSRIEGGTPCPPLRFQRSIRNASYSSMNVDLANALRIATSHKPGTAIHQIFVAHSSLTANRITGK